MPKVSEVIPEVLQPRVDAAVAWFNTSEEAAGDEFKVTGILDPDESMGADDELRLILCGGDRCEQYSFLVHRGPDAFQVSLAGGAMPDSGDKLQAELDPPPGPRLRWLDAALEKHEFVLLLFYRGFW